MDFLSAEIFKIVLFLTKTVRQKKSQTLLERLLRLRSGNITQNDWLEINTIFEQELPETERILVRSSRERLCCNRTGLPSVPVYSIANRQSSRYSCWQRPVCEIHENQISKRKVHGRAK